MNESHLSPFPIPSFFFFFFSFLPTTLFFSHQQYLAKPGSRPYCSAQPQGVALPDYSEWSPFAKDSAEYTKHEPTLPASFWAKHAPRRGCSVVQEPNDLILESSY